MMNKKICALIILDGFGYRKQKEYNAIAQAYTPHIHYLLHHYPHTIIKASGQAVGLPPGYIGNSEVGHLTMGAGRIVQQPITILNRSINDGSFFTNPILVASLDELAQKKNTLHIIGLVSDSGVHSHIKHLLAYISAAQQHQVKHIVIHAFLDGRDTAPQSSIKYLEQLADFIKSMPNVTIGSIHGRFYAMDRDNNWERTQQSYQVLTSAVSLPPVGWRCIIQDFYKKGITDEFIFPTALHSDAEILPGDGVIFFNIRSERMVQLVHALIDAQFTHFCRNTPPTLAFCLTPVYYETINSRVLFPHVVLQNSLKEVLSNAGKKIFCIAETEKYAHVTYFFGGNTSGAYANEKQLLIPSIKCKTYKDVPCMSADAITQAVLKMILQEDTDFYLINYANADMVAHSGSMHATVQAIECLDRQIALLYEVIVKQNNGTMIITSDHGNAEDMFDQLNNQPRTAHTTNPVPFIYVAKNHTKGAVKKVKELSHIAPFILGEMSICIPEEMEDKSAEQGLLQ
jgi:2,3-bisphosphoglycerate-independent phosphoglycerate mutase